MKNYVIRDVWMALSLAGKNALYGLVLLGVLAFLGFPYAVPLGALVAVQSVIIYFANRRYYIDNEAGTFTFPRSDIENRIFHILLLAPYWNLMRTRTVSLSDIENIYLDTQRWTSKRQKLFVPTNKDGSSSRHGSTVNKKHIRYTLNITGSFGSANLQFLSRQKRDELRNALQQSIKNASGRNVDKKVAEFS